LIVINNIENGHNIIGRCGQGEWGTLEGGKGEAGDDRGWKMDEGRKTREGILELCI
jgi:hypothetical protein